MGVIVNGSIGKHITYLCREDPRDMLHRSFDIEGAITTMDALDIDDDLRFTFELFFFLFHSSSPPHPSPLLIGEREGVRSIPQSAF